MTLVEKMDKLEEKIDKLEDQSSELRSAIERVDYETNEMRFAGALPTTIRSRVGMLAEEIGIDEKELEEWEHEIFECERNLENAVWNLVKPFKEKKVAIDNELYELKCQLEEQEDAGKTLANK